MKVHASAHAGKVVISSTCEGCSSGLHDILRPCPVCKRSVAEKANLRGAAGGRDRAVDAVVFCDPEVQP